MSKPTIVIYAECRNPETKGEKKLALNLALSLMNRETGYDIILSGHPDTITLYGQLSETPMKGNKIQVDGIDLNVAAIDDIDPDANEVALYIEVNRCRPCAKEALERIVNPHTKLMYIGTPKWAGFNLEAFLAESSRRVRETVPTLLQDYIKDKKDIFFYPTGIGPETAGLPKMPKHELHESEITRHFSGKQYGFIYAKHTSERDYRDNDEPPSEKDIRFILEYIKLSLQFMNPAEPACFVLIGMHTLILEALQERCQSLPQSIELISGIDDTKGPRLHFFKDVSAADMNFLCSHAIPFVAMTGTQSALEAARSGKLFLYQYLRENQAFISDFKHAVFCEIDKTIVSPTTIKSMKRLFMLTVNEEELDKSDTTALIELLSDATVCKELGNIYQKLIQSANDQLTDKIVAQLEPLPKKSLSV